MPTSVNIRITSPQTGQIYNVSFDGEPEADEVDEVADQLDTEFYQQQGLSPSIANQGPAMTGARSFMQLGTNMVEGVVGGGSRILGAMENAAADTLGTDRPGTFQPAAQFADAIGESGRDFWATNPANPIAQTVGAGAGQALTMLGTAGAAAPVLGTKLALTAVPVGLGAIQGGGAGVKTAQDMGIDNPFGQLGLGAAFAGAEALTERMGGIGGKAAAEMLQTGVKATLKQAAKSIGSEAIEEPISGTLQDAATFAAGQAVADPARPGYTANGYQLPALDAAFLNRRKMEAIGGAAGGTIFAGLQLAGTQPQSSGQPTPAPAPSATDPNSMAAIAARAGSQDVQWQTPEAPTQIGGRPVILGNVPDAQTQPTPNTQSPTAPVTVTEPTPADTRQPILGNVPDAPQPIRIGETVAYEGYTGTLVADGARYAVQVPNGPLVEVADSAALARATAAPQTAPQPPPAPAQPATPSPLPKLPDPQVSEATFSAAQDGSMAIQTPDGQTYLPHNPQLLRTVRTGPNGLEVLVRKPSEPGRIIKLVGAQAQSAQDAFLNAAANVEAAGGKVNWGSAKPRLQFSTLGSVWNKVKTITGLPARRFQQGDLQSLKNNARQTLAQGPATIQTPDGRTVAMMHNAQGTEDTLIEHLVTETNGAPSPERASWVSRIATTLQNAAVRVQSGNNHIYIARYSDRGRRDAHFVVVSPEGYVTAHGPLDALTTHWARNEQTAGKPPRKSSQMLGSLHDLEALQFSMRQKAVNPAVSDSGNTTGTRTNNSAQSAPTPGYTVWVNPESGLTQSQAQELLSQSLQKPAQIQPLATQFKGGLPALRKAVADAIQLLNQHIPGLLTPKVQIFSTVEELLASGLIDPATLTPEELANLETAEGFYDNLTGHTIIIASNVAMRPGESPRAAIARVLLHERVGHEGVNALIQSDASFAAKWDQLAKQIPTAELDAIAADEGYAHLASDRAQLALEWLARQTESIESARNAAAIEGGLKGLAKQMWNALKEFLQKALSAMSNQPTFRHNIAGLITQAREAALKGTADPTTVSALSQRLQFSNPLHKQGSPYRLDVKARLRRSILTGNANPTAFVASIAQDQREKAALQNTAAALHSMVDVASKDAAKQTGRSITSIFELINDVLDDKAGALATLQTVHPGLAEATRRSRNFIGECSQRIGHGLPTGPLRDAILSNSGWMRRSYAVYDATADWNYDSLSKAALENKPHAGQDARKIMREACSYLISQDSSLKGQTDALGLPKDGSQLELDIAALLNRETANSALVGTPSKARKNVTSLIARKEIPSQIRALMGEHTNPLTRFAASASFQSQYIARHQMQQNMRQIGLATGIFTTQAAYPYTKQIPTDNAWNGLSGIYTTQEIWDLLTDVNAADPMMSGDISGPIQKLYQYLTGNAKMNMVALNPRSTAVNFIGGLFSSIANADFAGAFVHGSETWKVIRSPKATPKSIQDAAAIALRDEELQHRVFLISSGVLQNELMLKEVEEANAYALHNLLTEEGKPNTTDRLMGAAHGGALGNALGRMAGPVGQVAGIVVGGTAGALVGGRRITQVHQKIANIILATPDKYWKVGAFFNQQRTALNAGMSPPNAAQWAADRVRNTYPDYDKVPHLVKQLSRLPFGSTFVSFPYELARNYANSAIYAAQDLRSGNPALMAAGLKRAVGLSIASIIAWNGFMATLGACLGWPEPEEEKEKAFSKWLAAPWDRGKSLSITRWDEEGVTYMNEAYLIPHAGLAQIFKSAAAGEDVGDIAWNFTSGVMSYFGLGSNINKALIEAAANQNSFGQAVSAEPGLTGIMERVDHVAKTYTDPGYAKVIQELVRAKNAGDEDKITRIYNGLMAKRERKMSWAEAATSGYRKFADEYQNIRDRARAQSTKSGEHLLTDRDQIVKVTNERITKLHLEFEQFEKDMKDVLKIPASAMRIGKSNVRLGKLSLIERDPSDPFSLRAVR